MIINAQGKYNILLFLPIHDLMLIPLGKFSKAEEGNRHGIDESPVTIQKMPVQDITAQKSERRRTDNWTVPREIDKKKSTCRRNASNYVALLRISYGVRPFFMVILS